MNVWETVLLSRKRTGFVLKALKLEKIPPHSPPQGAESLNDITMRNSTSELRKNLTSLVTSEFVFDFLVRLAQRNEERVYLLSLLQFTRRPSLNVHPSFKWRWKPAETRVVCMASVRTDADKL